MGLWEILRKLLGGPAPDAPADANVYRPAPAAPAPRGGGRTVEELARRLGVDAATLAAFRPSYRTFTVPKRSGGVRTIDAPDDATRSLQRTLLRRLLGRLPVHPAAVGFEPKRSIVHNAAAHAGRAVVVRMDLRDFFPSITDRRIGEYFASLGWDRRAVDILTRLCAHQGRLPQGAPTSPRLSNLVNYRLDVRLAALAEAVGRGLRPAGDARSPVVYTRYADDLTVSFAADDRSAIEGFIHLTGQIARDEGYKLHTRKKLRIMRSHDRQAVSGLVVNVRPALSRQRRRWLRAVRHRLARGQAATLAPAQLAGWEALAAMVVRQRQGDTETPPRESS